MPIISVEVMKTIDERELQKTTKEKQTKTERSKGNRSYSESYSEMIFDMLLKPSFKMTTSFANIARTTASTSKFTY